jgi:CRP/FNR family transcriptional regulator, nitrogen fixation regulation protein
MPGRVLELLQQQPGVKYLTRRSIPSVEAEGFDSLIDRIGVQISYAPKERIFHENGPADSLYKVISGLVCTRKFLRNGRRQISGFYLPGDYFGFEWSDAHTLSAEAVTNAKVRQIKKSVLAAVANRDAKRHLLLLATGELARLQDRVLLLIKNAQERVGEFILEMDKRSKVGNAILLLMTRQDIADYLGLRIETVSRILTSLESSAAIEIPTLHQIVLRSHSVLRTAMEDQSKGGLSNQHPSQKYRRKRSDRRRHLIRSPARQRVSLEATSVQE